MPMAARDLIRGSPEQIEAMFPKLDASQIAGISATKFALPKQRKEPLENVSHVRTAVAGFNQVKGVTDAERRAAWKRIRSAAKRYGVELEESISLIDTKKGRIDGAKL